MLKTCRRCGFDKPSDLFTKNKQNQDGLHSWCKSCFSDYMASRSRERQKILDTVKLTPCVDCGDSLPPFCMDLDHVKGDKIRGVSGMLTFSEPRFRAEISKCSVVCANCHRVRTAAALPSTKHPKIQRFRDRVALIKLNPCVDCQRVFPSVAMDFDHVRGEKVFMVSAMLGQAWHRVLDEIAKCDLVCACCHRIRTQTRRALEGSSHG